MTLGRYITECAEDKGLGDVLGTCWTLFAGSSSPAALQTKRGSDAIEAVWRFGSLSPRLRVGDVAKRDNNQQTALPKNCTESRFVAQISTLALPIQRHN